MCLVPLMRQILWLTSETSMKIALFSNFECHRVPAWVRYPPQPITCYARDRNYTWYKYTLLYLLCKYTVSIIRLSHFLFSVPWICITCIQFHSVLRIIRIHIFLSDISHLFHLIRRISFLPFFSDVQTESISKYSSPLQQQQITIYTIFILSTSFPIQKG